MIRWMQVAHGTSGLYFGISSVEPPVSACTVLVG